jgi:hypothetical protein
MVRSRVNALRSVVNALRSRVNVLLSRVNVVLSLVNTSLSVVNVLRSKLCARAIENKRFVFARRRLCTKTAGKAKVAQASRLWFQLKFLCCPRFFAGHLIRVGAF